MTLNNVFKQLTTKKFKIYMFHETAKSINFVEVLEQLIEFSDFFQFSKDERLPIANEWLKKKEIYVDADRIIKII